VSEAKAYQYLESMDSVRTPFRAAADDDELQEISKLQIFSEVLMTLILGREVVVPQSYAFDSYGFLQVARTFLDARDTAGASAEHPFRPHLFGAGVDSFDDAVTSILARVDDPNRPFVSSAFPELNDPEKTSPSIRPRDVHWLLRRDWLDDARRASLAAVHDEFARLGPVIPRPYPNFASLQDLLKTFIDPEVFSKPNEREVYERLVRAIKALDPSRSALDLRSTLRANHPLPGDPAGRTPAEIVGDAETLDDVIEFIDTLYNAVIVGSIGVATPTFSTGVVTDEDRLAPKRIAQHLAVVRYQLRPGELGRPDDRTFATAKPMFEVHEAGVAAKDGVHRLYHEAEETLPELFRERARRRSQFWIGLDNVRTARAASDAAATRKAMEKHLAYVSRVLGRDIDVQMSHEGLVGLALGVGSAGGTTFATATWALPPSIQGLIAGTGAAIGFGAGIATMYPRWRDARRRAAALLEIVDL
jgi:hypothetical protein